jgi:hypothetical protein
LHVEVIVPNYRGYLTSVGYPPKFLRIDILGINTAEIKTEHALQSESRGGKGDGAQGR